MDHITSPLKLFVSRVATEGLQAFGIPIMHQGVTLIVAQYQLLVEDACSGMNSLVGLTAIGLDGTVPGIDSTMRGQKPSEELFAEAGRLASLACDPVADQRGPIDYKRHLADELTRRVLRRASERAAQTQEG